MTHHSLPEAEILALKPLILEHYFDAVITTRLRQLACQQAELVALKLAMLAGHNMDHMPSRLVRYSEQNVSSAKSSGG